MISTGIRKENPPDGLGLAAVKNIQILLQNKFVRLLLCGAPAAVTRLHVAFLGRWLCLPAAPCHPLPLLPSHWISFPSPPTVCPFSPFDVPVDSWPFSPPHGRSCMVTLEVCDAHQLFQVAPGGILAEEVRPGRGIGFFFFFLGGDSC